jgi:hypothetical protein
MIRKAVKTNREPFGNNLFEIGCRKSSVGEDGERWKRNWSGVISVN